MNLQKKFARATAMKEEKEEATYSLESTSVAQSTSTSASGYFIPPISPHFLGQMSRLKGVLCVRERDGDVIPFAREKRTPDVLYYDSVGKRSEQRRM